ncbi:MAG: 1-deoxy-D-xylulose-5-phosphate synthase N-terminal domain-containing protein [Dysosmobacter sp.]
MILETIHSPADVKALDRSEQLPALPGAAGIFGSARIQTGGHLASNLGAVELTVAIHRVFDTAVDRLVFDVGHQCYIHKAVDGTAGAIFHPAPVSAGSPAFPNPGRASMTHSSPAMRPTRFP